MPHPIWTRESIIASLKAEARRLGGATPTWTHLHRRRAKGATPCPRTIVRLFGSLGAAEIEAGLALNVVGRKRQSRCKSGLHALREPNLVWHRSGQSGKRTRQCRKCLRARQRIYERSRALAQRAAKAGAVAA